MSFEPFIDWDAMSDEMVDDLHEAVAETYTSRDKFMARKSKENAIALMRSQRRLGEVALAVEHTLFTVPVMVHVAGDRMDEVDRETGKEIVTQRCKRCGSLLQAWEDGVMLVSENGLVGLHVDDVSWWHPGDLVAKASQDENPMSMYVIEDRDLDNHEMPCVDLSELGE